MPVTVELLRPKVVHEDVRPQIADLVSAADAMLAHIADNRFDIFKVASKFDTTVIHYASGEGRKENTQASPELSLAVSALVNLAIPDYQTTSGHYSWSINKYLSPPDQDLNPTLGWHRDDVRRFLFSLSPTTRIATGEIDVPADYQPSARSLTGEAGVDSDPTDVFFYWIYAKKRLPPGARVDHLKQGQMVATDSRHPHTGPRNFTNQPILRLVGIIDDRTLSPRELIATY